MHGRPPRTSTISHRNVLSPQLHDLLSGISLIPQDLQSVLSLLDLSFMSYDMVLKLHPMILHRKKFSSLSLLTLFVLLLLTKDGIFHNGKLSIYYLIAHHELSINSLLLSLFCVFKVNLILMLGTFDDTCFFTAYVNFSDLDIILSTSQLNKINLFFIILLLKILEFSLQTFDLCINNRFLIHPFPQLAIQLNLQLFIFTLLKRSFPLEPLNCPFNIASFFLYLNHVGSIRQAGIFLLH
jgi:hypothetical protein